MPFTSLCCFSHGSESASNHHKDLHEEEWFPLGRWGPWDTDGFHDLSREAKATCSGFAEPRTSRLSQILPSPELTPQFHVFGRAKSGKGWSNSCLWLLLILSASVWASAELFRGEEGSRGWGADGASSTLDKFLPFFLLEFCSSCGRISDAEMCFSLIQSKGGSVILPGSYQVSRRRRWLAMRQVSFQ